MKWVEENHSAIDLALIELNHAQKTMQSPPNPLPDHIKRLLKPMNSMLAPIAKITEVLSIEQNVSFSIVLHCVKQLISKLKTAKQ